MNITGIFVKYLSSLSSTFFGQDVFFSTSLYIGRHRESPIKDNIRAYLSPNYPSTASEFNWLHNEISVCFHVERGMENSAPPRRHSGLNDPEQGRPAIAWRWQMPHSIWKRNCQHLYHLKIRHEIARFIMNRYFYRYFFNKDLFCHISFSSSWGGVGGGEPQNFS